MTLAQQLREGFREVGFALRRPEEFTVRWRDQKNPPVRAVFHVLLFNAVFGLAAFGLTMGVGAGAGAMLAGAWKAPLAAGAAWTLALPALYIINSALGSKLDGSTTVLAALTTASFGALALLAGVPIAWFFAVAVPYAWVQSVVQVVIFFGVGVAMVDVFLRTMGALEPGKSRWFAWVWLGLVGFIGAELMVFLDLFNVRG